MKKLIHIALSILLIGCSKEEMQKSLQDKFDYLMSIVPALNKIEINTFLKYNNQKYFFCQWWQIVKIDILCLFWIIFATK